MSGAICDVCGKHILPIFDDDCNPFSCGDFEGTLFCHTKCKPFILEMSEKKDWKVLPEGPMRTAYEKWKPLPPEEKKV